MGLNEKMFQVGWVQGPHGLKGGVYVRLFTKQMDWFHADIKSLCLHQPSHHLTSSGKALGELPGFNAGREIIGPSRPSAHLPIESLRPFKEGCLVYFKGRDSIEQVETFKGLGVYVPTEALVAPAGERPFLGEFVGCEIHTKEGEYLGQVVEVSSNGAQDLLEVQGPKGRGLIPLVAEFVIATDWSQHKVVMDLPGGLFE